MRTVYVLGAGASKAIRFNAPLMSELMKNIHSATQDIPELWEFISAVYHSIHDPTQLPPMEDILTLLDGAIKQNRPLKNYDVRTLHKIRNNLIFGMALAIRKGVNTDDDKDLEDSLKLRFLNSIQSNDTIISLNYDIIMDNLLLREKVEHINYGLQVRSLLNDSTHNDGAVPYKHADNSPVLLKLHGSLNWLYCPVCQSIDVTERQKSIFPFVFKHKPTPTNTGVYSCKCGSKYQTIIITPTFLKEYENSYLLELWRVAEQKISEAERAIFIGYSMPDADMLLRTMIVRALHTNRAVNKRRPVLELVEYVKNGDESKGENTAYARFKRLLGEPDYYTSHSLKQFIQDRC